MLGHLERNLQPNQGFWPRPQGVDRDDHLAINISTPTNALLATPKRSSNMNLGVVLLQHRLTLQAQACFNMGPAHACALQCIAFLPCCKACAMPQPACTPNPHVRCAFSAANSSAAISRCRIIHYTVVQSCQPIPLRCLLPFALRPYRICTQKRRMSVLACGPVYGHIPRPLPRMHPAIRSRSTLPPPSNPTVPFPTSPARLVTLVWYAAQVVNRGCPAPAAHAAPPRTLFRVTPQAWRGARQPARCGLPRQHSEKAKKAGPTSEEAEKLSGSQNGSRGTRDPGGPWTKNGGPGPISSAAAAGQREQAHRPSPDSLSGLTCSADWKYMNGLVPDQSSNSSH